MKIDTKCSYCSQPITKYSRSKKIHNYFCSLECKWKFMHRKTFTDVKCGFCGKTFERKKSELKRTKVAFCSKECCAKSLTGSEYYVQVVCSQCGKPFQKYKKNKERLSPKNDFCSAGCYFKFKSQKETNRLRIYYYQVGRETRKWENELLESSNMICYYTGQKLISNKEFKKLFPEKHVNCNEFQPTIDHKISIKQGFTNNISASVIGRKDNLCVCARYVNRIKWTSTEKEFQYNASPRF